MECKHKKMAYWDRDKRKWKLTCQRCGKVFKEMDDNVRGFDNILAELRRENG